MVGKRAVTCHLIVGRLNHSLIEKTQKQSQDVSEVILMEIEALWKVLMHQNPGRFSSVILHAPIIMKAKFCGAVGTA